MISDTLISVNLNMELDLEFWKWVCFYLCYGEGDSYRLGNSELVRWLDLIDLHQLKYLILQQGALGEQKCVLLHLHFITMFSCCGLIRD